MSDGITRVVLNNGETRYRVRVLEGGRKRNITVRTKKDALEARQVAQDRERRRRAGLPEPRAAITYSELTEIFLDQYQVGGRRTKKWMEEMLAYSRTAFDPVHVRHLMPDQIGRWLNNLPVGTKTRQHALAAMRQVLSAGVVWGYLEVSPARPEAVKSPPSVAPDVRPFESWNEVHAVAAKTAEYGPLIRFACATGLRPEEWIALEWRDIDRAARTLRVQRTFTAGSVSRDAKTAAGMRSVALQAAALDALGDLPTALRTTQLIFPSASGGYLNLGNFRRRVWYNALEAAGPDRRPLYQMRHTYATLALAAGARIEWVSRQMGHRDIRTTLRFYARFLPEVDQRNLALLDGFARESTAVVGPGAGAHVDS
jgi:integrase